MKNKLFARVCYSISILMLLLLFVNLSMVKVKADTASSISFGTIDYDALTMQVYNNSNSIVYYSTDKTNWYEIESPYHSTTSSYTMDISWVSDTSETTLYFKGNIVKTIKSITLPMKNSSLSVTYDKATGEFSFDDTEDAQYFEWRKATDYTWTRVAIDEDASSYKEFIDIMNSYRVAGARIYIRTLQVNGTSSSNVGVRPSKEILITIAKRASAPSILVNFNKLTLNTKESMEYYDTTLKMWTECSLAMPLEDIAPSVLYENGAKSVTLKIRYAETSSSPYSKTAFVTIEGQSAPPVIGDNSADVTYYYVNSKLTLQFQKASTTVPYEYTVVKSDDSFDSTTASWRTVTNSGLMTISKTLAPEDCRVYVRRKGINSVLPSAASKFSVKYPGV